MLAGQGEKADPRGCVRAVRRLSYTGGVHADHPLLPILNRPPGPTGPPVFDRIAIVGLGLIGGSIALAARQAWPSSLVIGVDRNEVIEQAVARHAIDVAASDLAIISEAELVILAAPVAENLHLLSELGRHLERPAVVTDVGSTKRAIVEAARMLPPHLVFVGGHPLAGSTGSGIDAARPDLFGNRPWLFTPSGATNDEVLAKLQAFATALGAVPSVIDAGTHDHLVAFISHLPQLTVSTLMAIVGDAAGGEGLALSGRGLVDTTRLAGSPAGIWKDICRTNADEIGVAIDTLVRALQRLRSRLDEGATIEETFGAANRWRHVLEEKKR